MDEIDAEVKRQARETLEVWQARSISPRDCLLALGVVLPGPRSGCASWDDVEEVVVRMIREFNGVRS